ncbi:unnamed protein product [Paramecium sonneborni]|uniref:Uncharacterized protein n=1 Tax=Paramecium sonneborni TaxID=65129 RepID=A0A8S1MS92_9CILI|nr:unnamed protein product [Paramecium sonneborni]
MLFSKEPSNKKKFYYRNILTSSSKYQILKLNQTPQIQSVSNSNLLNIHHKTSLTFHLPQKSQHIINSETPRHKRYHTNKSQQLIQPKSSSGQHTQKSSKERRAPLHNKKIPIADSSLHIADYIELLKNKSQSNLHYKYSDLLKDQSLQTSSIQFKLSTPKKTKEESRIHLQLLLQCTHTIAKIKDAPNFQSSIINSFTHQYPNLSLIIDQFIQDLDVAVQLYNTENQLSQTLLRITGLDYKIFHLLFKPKQDFPQSHLQFKIDDDFFLNYKFYKPTKYDIYYRVYGAGELPLEFQEQLGEFNPRIIKYRFKESEYQAAMLLKEQTPILDQDFVRKIIYYQKNLSLFLKQKSNEVLNSFKEQLNQDEYSNNNNILRQTILSKLIDSEHLIGNFPHITRSNRYMFEKMELQLQNKNYSQRLQVPTN